MHQIRAGPRMHRRGVDRSNRFDLGSGEATRSVVSLAQQHSRIDLAVLRIFDDAVLNAVLGIACVESGLVDDWKFAFRDEALRGSVCCLIDPHLGDAVMGAPVRESDRRGHVEVGGPILHELQRVAAARAPALIHQRELGTCLVERGDDLSSRGRPSGDRPRSRCRKTSSQVSRLSRVRGWCRRWPPTPEESNHSCVS